MARLTGGNIEDYLPDKPDLVGGGVVAGLPPAPAGRVSQMSSPRLRLRNQMLETNYLILVNLKSSTAMNAVMLAGFNPIMTNFQGIY